VIVSLEAMAILHVVNDTVIASGPLYADYTPRELGVRNGMIILTIFVPIVAAFFSLFYTPGWAERRRLFSFSNLVALWFLSIGIVGIGLYVLPGQGPRALFIIAVLHGEIEVLLNTLLLGFTGKQGITIAWLWGLVQLGLTLTLKSPVWVYSIVAIIGGANDFLILQALAYGRKWGLALGALFHIISAVNVFIFISVNFGVVEFNVVNFFALWGQAGFLVAYFLNIPRTVIPPTDEERDIEFEDPPSNPLHDVKFTPKLIAIFIALGLLGSTIITYFTTFVFPAPA